MFPFLLCSNENDYHSENDSHFGPLRGSLSAIVSTHYRASRGDITFPLHFRTSALRAFGLTLHFRTLAQETCACLGVVIHPYSPMRMIIIRI